jgi:hypothetical protein
MQNKMVISIQATPLGPLPEKNIRGGDKMNKANRGFVYGA